MASSSQRHGSSSKGKQNLEVTTNPPAKTAHVGTGCTRKCFSCIHTENPCPVQSKLLDNCLISFLNRGVPCQFMVHIDGEWTDFPKSANEILIDGFKAGHSYADIETTDCRVIIDFLSMTMVNLATKEHHPIAWIDEDDKCCFPKSFTDAGEEVSNCTDKKQVQLQSNRK